MVDPADYDKDIPRIQEHLCKFERSFGKVRGTHMGRPVDEIRQALLEEFESEGWPCGAKSRMNRLAVLPKSRWMRRKVSYVSCISCVGLR